ncbi:SatD family protein [Clostridium bornimense]|uniref:SatD family protein n=1 Tax=Clostridium bornimense TaxID=1216932 RepID=UPI001C111988|nr:SatD family protein [Clostridium bornimense]MBU5317607.1 SatD family protein [Clostridium bornimense]
MLYIAMICDIKNSRNINNRLEVQLQLIDMLKKCNKKFKDFIISPFIITIGDEWQGLLSEYACYNDIIDFFKENLSDNIEFYTAIGYGKVSITNFELTVNQLDGEAFYLARRAIRYCKKHNLNLVALK